MTSASLTARSVARAQLTAAIKDEARRQLAEVGAAALSLRAVARQLGMASSALYRYFPSRDELLTALIVDAYDSLGAAAEAAEAAAGGAETFEQRFVRVGRAVRGWARRNPHEYALIYGSPVPGYAAPTDTVGPASRVTLVLAGLVAEAWISGEIDYAHGSSPTFEGAVAGDLDRVALEAMPGVPLPTVLRAVGVWAQLFGLVSFELFGHFENVVEARDEFFDAALTDMARQVRGRP